MWLRFQRMILPPVFRAGRYDHRVAQPKTSQHIRVGPEWAKSMKRVHQLGLPLARLIRVFLEAVASHDPLAEEFIRRAKSARR